MYQFVTSASKISLMASYAINSLFDLSADGLKEETLYVPKIKGSSSFPFKTIETDIHFPSSGIFIFATVILKILASQFPNEIWLSEQILSVICIVSEKISVFVISPPSKDIFNCLSTLSSRNKSWYL